VQTIAHFSAILGEVQHVLLILRLAPWMSAGWYMDVPLEQDKEDMLHFTELLKNEQ